MLVGLFGARKFLFFKSKMVEAAGIEPATKPRKRLKLLDFDSP